MNTIAQSVGKEVSETFVASLADVVLSQIGNYNLILCFPVIN